MPAGYLLAGESAIVTDVIYDYRPTFGLFLSSFRPERDVQRTLDAYPAGRGRLRQPLPSRGEVPG